MAAACLRANTYFKVCDAYMYNDTVCIKIIIIKILCTLSTVLSLIIKSQRNQYLDVFFYIFRNKD